MAILFADGFELGTTLAEANTMSGNTLVNSGNFSVSTVTMGAKSTGTGSSVGAQSMSMNYTPNSTSTGTFFYAGVAIPQLATVSSSMTSLAWGFRAKANPNFAATVSSQGGIYFGIGNLSYTSQQGFQLVRSTGTGGSYVMQADRAVVGANPNPAMVLDNNWHYHTYYFVKTGSTWTVQQYLDSTLLGTFTGVTITWPASPYMLYYSSIGGTGQMAIFSEVDDVYISANTGPLGIINIRKLTPTSDIQAQFTQIGTAGTNYGSIDNISLTSTNGLTASGSATDIYGNSATITPGMKAIAYNNTAIGTGSSDSLTTTMTNGTLTVNSATTTLGSLDTRVSTGWDTTLAGVAPAAVQFGMAKT